MVNLNYLIAGKDQVGLFINYRKVFLQVLIILIYVGVRYLARRIFHAQRHRQEWRICTVILFWALACWNLGYYWIAFPIAVWMLWSLILIILQVVHNHEFLYRRFWPPFWYSSMVIAVVTFALSLFAGALPLV